MAERENEGDQGEPIAEEAEGASGGDAADAGQMRAGGAGNRVLTAPAINPFNMAIWAGSAPETLRVRLLSIAQARQAPGDQECRRDAGAPEHRRPGEDDGTGDDRASAD